MPDDNLRLRAVPGIVHDEVPDHDKQLTDLEERVTIETQDGPITGTLRRFAIASVEPR